MGIITTQVAGFGAPKPKPSEKADPKPVRGFNYAGVPMKDGEYYNGRPEHMAPCEPKKVGEVGVGKGGFTRSEEVRKMAKVNAIAQHARARAGGVEVQEKKRKRWHWTKEMRAKARERSLAAYALQKAEQEMKKANPEQSG